jgi:uncharacterized protein YjbJ (UPF0337 family)
MAENERIKHDVVDAFNSVKGAAKETVGNLAGRDDLVDEGREEQRQSGYPPDDDDPAPSNELRGGGRVSGERSGREW